ncbi:hypothetical protein ABK040_005015 [Willaertia magna]
MPTITEVLGTSLVKVTDSGSLFETVNDLTFLEGKKVLLFFGDFYNNISIMFTLKLVEMFNTLKEEGLQEDKFNVLYVSKDLDELCMYQHMKMYRMPWLALPQGDKSVELVKKFNVNRVPFVVLLNSNMERDERCYFNGYMDDLKQFLLE